MDELNSKNRIDIRRYHNQLKVTSNGVLILGVWSVLKTFLTSITGTDQLGIPRANTTADLIFTVIGYGIVLLIDFRLRMIVWRGARKEAYGRDTNNKYIFVTVLLILVSGFSFVAICYYMIKTHEHISTHLASILIESASFVIMCELLYSALKIRKIRSNLSVRKEEAA